MSTWSAGYVLDIQYTSGFYRELAPTYLQFVALTQGIRPPAIKGATYCELACGQGFGTSLLAAANPHTQFWGFDFNPAQVANARRLAAQAGLQNVTFEDLSFEQMLSLPEGTLPKFDFITMHGIYSWISPENRRFIVEFLDRHLKPGGIVYVSYNCMPGWAQAAPLQRLMREHANRNPDRSDIQAVAALQFAERLKSGNAGYFVQNPALAPRMDKLPSLNKNYLAHEYMNGHWHPLYHLDVAKEMESARLSYVGSATIAENIDAVSVPVELHSLLQETRDRGWAETIRDYASNKQFRRDVYIRGAFQLTQLELGKTLNQMMFALTAPRDVITFKFQGPLNEVTGQEEVYKPVADALAQKPHTFAELAELPGIAGRPRASLLQALSMLVHAGQVHPVSHDDGKEGGNARVFNRAVVERITVGESLNFLAAPTAGSGIAASYTELLAMLALSSGKDALKSAVEFSWNIMQQTAQGLLKDGKILQTKEENLAELEVQLAEFFTKKLPLWRQLGVI